MQSTENLKSINEEKMTYFIDSISDDIKGFKRNINISLGTFAFLVIINFDQLYYYGLTFWSGLSIGVFILYSLIILLDITTKIRLIRLGKNIILRLKSI